MATKQSADSKTATVIATAEQKQQRHQELMKTLETLIGSAYVKQRDAMQAYIRKMHATHGLVAIMDIKATLRYCSSSGWDIMSAEAECGSAFTSRSPHSPEGPRMSFLLYYSWIDDDTHEKHSDLYAPQYDVKEFESRL